MTARPPKRDDVASPRGLSFYSPMKSLKGQQSLADSLQDESPYQMSPTEDYFKLPPSELRQNTGHVTPPSQVEIPNSLPVSAELALVALQYLPTPLLVLSEAKTVILANDAMGLLLGLNKYGSEDSKDLHQDEKDIAVGDLLEGQTLSQIGVDMVQDGQPVWVTWEVNQFLPPVMHFLQQLIIFYRNF